MKFQDKLQILRKQKLLSQERLAEMIGVSRQAVAKWEIGQSYPDLLNLIALSELFRVSIDHLVKNNDDENCLSLPTKDLIQVDKNAIAFLCRAKKSTYAGKGPKAISSRPESHDLHYEEGPLKYIDSYLAENNLPERRLYGWMIDHSGP